MKIIANILVDHQNPSKNSTTYKNKYIETPQNIHYSEDKIFS